MKKKKVKGYAAIVRELETQGVDKTIGNMAKEKPKITSGVDDEKLVKWVSRKLREIYYGKKTYSKKRFRPSGKRK